MVRADVEAVFVVRGGAGGFDLGAKVVAGGRGDGAVGGGCGVGWIGWWGEGEGGGEEEEERGEGCESEGEEHCGESWGVVELVER